MVRVEARRRLPATGIIWREDGLIVTAHHVVKRDDNITIGLADGSSVSASVVGRDPTTDTAVLRAEASSLTPLVESDKKNLGVSTQHVKLPQPLQKESGQKTGLLIISQVQTVDVTVGERP